MKEKKTVAITNYNELVLHVGDTSIPQKVMDTVYFLQLNIIYSRLNATSQLYKLINNSKNKSRKHSINIHCRFTINLKRKECIQLYSLEEFN